MHRGWLFFTDFTWQYLALSGAPYYLIVGVWRTLEKDTNLRSCTKSFDQKRDTFLIKKIGTWSKIGVFFSFFRPIFLVQR